MNNGINSEEECQIADLLFQKEEVLPSLKLSFRQFEQCGDVVKILENVQLATQFLSVLDINDIEEELFVFLMPTLIKIIKKILNENNKIAINDNEQVLNSLKSNLEKALSVIAINKVILEYIIKFNAASYRKIPSVPLNISQIILYTFEHCKNSQSLFHVNLKSLSEIVVLFKETQELHSKFLNFLDNCLVFEFLDKNHVLELVQLLEIISKIGQVLSGMNAKSMVDNWKGFTNLIQKTSNVLNSPNLGVSITILAAEIGTTFKAVHDLGDSDVKKSTQSVKIVGFLVKVVLKLFEIFPNEIINNFNEVMYFYAVLYSHCCGYFEDNNMPSVLKETIHESIYASCDLFVAQIASDCFFMKKLSGFTSGLAEADYNAGFLVFLNKILQNLPAVKKQSNVQLAPLISLTFNTISNCNLELMSRLNSDFYEDLLTNIAVSVLLFPNEYAEIEMILIQTVLQDNIWAAISAIDSWRIILRYFPANTCRLILKVLIKKIKELKLGKFIETPQMVYLRIFVNELFRILPESAAIEEISKYNPSNNAAVWKILNMKCIPISQRFHIEYVLDDLYEKMIKAEKQMTMDEMISLMEVLNTISEVNFNDLQINLARFGPVVHRYWSFNSSKLANSNNFHKYFVTNLAKITQSLASDLTAVSFLLIFKQLTQTTDSLFKLITCDMLKTIVKKNFTLSFQEKTNLFSQISDIFVNLLIDGNQIIQQIALETFHEFSTSKNWSEVVVKVQSRSLIAKKLIEYYSQRIFPRSEYNMVYLNSLKNAKFYHNCIEWKKTDACEDEEEPIPPNAKKAKYEMDVDDILDDLKGSCTKLGRIRVAFTSQQKKELQIIIKNLDKISLINSSG